MRSETDTALVAVQVEPLWDYLSDYRNVVRLESRDGVARLIEGRRGTPRAKYKGVHKWEGIESPYVMRLETCERPQRLTWKARSMSGVTSLGFELAPDAGATQVTCTITYEPAASSRALEPFAWALLRPMFRRLVRKLRDLDIDAEQPAEG